MDDRLKRRIRVMRELMKRLDGTELGLRRRTGGRMDLLTSFNCDILMYVLFLSGSDDRVDESEALIVRRYLGYDVTVEDLENYISEHRLSVDSFTLETPLTLQALCHADREIRSERYQKEMRGEAGPEEDYVPASILLREIYQGLGEAVVYSDADVDESENRDYTTFLAQVDAYILDALGMTEEELQDKRELLLQDAGRDEV